MSVCLDEEEEEEEGVGSESAQKGEHGVFCLCLCVYVWKKRVNKLQTENGIFFSFFFLLKQSRVRAYSTNQKPGR